MTNFDVARKSLQTALNAKSDSKLVNLPNVMALGLGIFQGKNNSGKSTWDSPHAFFKMTYAA